MRFRLLILALLFTTGTKAQVTNLFFENFNNGFPASWTRIDLDGLVPQASVSFVNNAWVAYEDVDSVGTGDSVAVATSYYNPAGSANDWMITPAITLKNHGNILSWQVKSQDPSYPDGYDVFVTNTAPVPDSFVVPGRRFFQTDFELPDWTNRQVSLDTFANQTVYIAFRAKSNDQFLLLVDNIYVYADSLLSVHENMVDEALSVYPNPTYDVLHISGTTLINQVALFDVSGKNVLRQDLQSPTATLSLQALDKGAYILQIFYTNGRQKQVKVIRQ